MMSKEFSQGEVREENHVFKSQKAEQRALQA